VKISQECFHLGKTQDSIPDLNCTLVHSNFVMKGALRGTANFGTSVSQRVK